KRRTHGDSNVSRSDSVAEGDGASSKDLSINAGHARFRKIRFDAPDETSRRFYSIEYCRRVRSPKPRRLRPFPENCARLPGRVGNPAIAPTSTWFHCLKSRIERHSCRDRTGSSGSDPKPDSQGIASIHPPCLRAFVPSCLPPPETWMPEKVHKLVVAE